MKKILLAVMTASLLAGCAKNTDMPVLEDQEIKVEFEIAEKPSYSADTKAIKEEWGTFDEIRVAFSDDSYGVGNTFPYLTDNDYTISFLRMPDGSWRTGKNHLTSAKLQDLNGFGVYKAVHHSGSVNFGQSDPFGTTLKDYKGGEYLVAEGEYEVIGDVLKLKGVIQMKRPTNLMQISVKNLHLYDGGDEFKLSVSKYTSGNELTGVTHLKTGSLSLDSQVNVLVNPNNYMQAEGVTVGNDRVFCFYIGDSSNITETKAFRFELSNETESFTYSKICGLKPGSAYLLPSLTYEKEPGVYAWQ